MTRFAYDPITRVNGPLRIEVEVLGGVVTDAWCSAQMYRGLEGILEGRDARDAWLLAQRICGTCGSAHALASVSAVENALGVTVPTNARLLRNILVASKTVVDHAVGFYLRHALDWVDPTAALEADPTAASTFARSLSDRAGTSPADLKTARDRLSALIGTSQSGPLANGYWRHAAYSLAPEPSLVVLAHYLEALDWQREMARLHVLLGGKSPHPQTFVLGGMTLTPPWGGPKRPDTGQHPWQSNRNTPSPLSDEGLAEIRALIKKAQAFVTEVYLPDVLTIAEEYRDWSEVGAGIGHYLAFGAYPEDGTDDPAVLLPRGRVMDRDVSRLVAVDQTGVAESVAHSYYLDAGGGALVHPPDAQTDPAYAGPTPPFTTLAGFDRYSWSKAPRYEDDPMEVGPAARMLVAYAAGVGEVKTTVDTIASRLRSTPAMLGSTLGRTVARAVEAKYVGARLTGWLDALVDNLATGDIAVADVTKWDPGTWPADAEGWSLGESPGGAIGHWLRIADHRIASYQVVDGTTWNGSPRDQRGRLGAIERALVGTPVVHPERPVEVLRTLHSFDPCPACGVH
jgi:Ni,Fe-hydrogenase I large subunit